MVGLRRLLIRKEAISAIPLLGLLVGILIFHNSRCSAPNENDPHLIQLKKLASEMPVYEGCQKTGEKVVMKSTLIYYSVYYRCSAKFPEVMAFYDRVLRANGFARPKKDESPGVLTGSYRRGDQEIALQKTYSEPDHFDLVFMWNPQ